MKVEEQRIGVRSHTMTALVYMEDLIEPQILRMIKDRMEQYEIDGIMDSGMLESASGRTLDVTVSTVSDDRAA